MATKRLKASCGDWGRDSKYTYRTKHMTRETQHYTRRDNNTAWQQHNMTTTW
jgi:hypothetical protein